MTRDSGMRAPPRAGGIAILGMAQLLGLHIRAAIEGTALEPGRPHRLSRRAIKRHRSTSGFMPHNGDRECARRVRQMAAGRLDYSASDRCIEAIALRAFHKEIA